MLSKLFGHHCKYRTQVEDLQTRLNQLEALVGELKIQLEHQQDEITALKAALWNKSSVCLKIG
jgi:peptidoglycan hydrolase CwlO-like protein